jgi:hypothetical protein
MAPHALKAPAKQIHSMTVNNFIMFPFIGLRR